MNQEHPIAQKLLAIITREIEDADKAQAVAANILKMLDNEKVLYYADPGRLQILNTHGRTLVAILEDPGITQRALSVYLRVSESNVQKSLRMLLGDGIIKKERRGNRNTYSFDVEKGMSHPDVRRLLTTLLPLMSES